MSPRRPPHDALFKAAFSQLDNLIGELRALLPASLLADLDFSTAELQSGSFVDEELRACHSDLLWSVEFRGRRTLLYILLEHQSTPNPLMPFRFLVYIVRIWERWLAANPEATSLPAVIPLLVYQGPGRWSAPRQFSELIDLPPAAMADLGAYLPTFELLLDELSECSEAEIRSREASAFGLASLLLLRSARESADLLALLASMVDLLREIEEDPSSLEMILSYTLRVGDFPLGDLRKLLTTQIGKRAAETVMTTAERLRREGLEEGIEQGIEKGIEQGIEKERRDLVARQARLRFGALGPQELARIQEATTSELRSCADRILTASSFDDLFTDSE